MKNKSTRGFRLHRDWIPIIVFGVTVLITLAATAYEKSVAEASARTRFRNAVFQTKDLINSRLNTYIALLHAGSGLFGASRSVERSEFKVFVERLRLREHYPGMQGIGYSVCIPAAKKNALIRTMRQQGAPDFHIWPETPRSEYHSIIYLEPLDRRNRAAVGYDMHTEQVRRVAMDLARDTGDAVASGKVILKQEIDTPKQAGILVYFPVYENGRPPGSVAERRQKLAGFIYSPFRADDLLGGLVSYDANAEVDFQVYDGNQPSPESLLHDSRRVREGKASATSQRFTASSLISVGGRSWLVHFESRPVFDMATADRVSVWVLVVGMAVSFIFFVLTRSLAMAQGEAEEYADDLSKSEEALREANTSVTNILESIRDGFASFDRQWRFVYVNERGAQLTHRVREDVIGRVLWDVYPALVGTREEQELCSAMANQTSTQFDAYDSALRIWFEIRAYPSADGLSVYFADITLRKHSEAVLEAEYRKERTVSGVLQEALLSPSLHAVPGVRLDASYRAAVQEASVGGDFYDIFSPTPDLVGVVIGDVAGKGVQAAVRTAMAKNALRAFAYEDASPASVLARLNKVVAREMSEGFVTLFYGVLDIPEKEFIFANAGHEPPLWVLPEDPRVIDLEFPGTALGCDENAEYTQHRIELDSGHRILFYTDGVTEARRGHDFFDIARLRDLLLVQARRPAQDVIPALMKAVDDFSGGELRDDVAVMLLSLD